MTRPRSRWLASAVVVGATVSACAGPAAAPDSATTTSASAAPARADFAKPVDIGGGRRLYLRCQGTGSPTVVLVSTANGSSDEWTQYADMAQQKLVESPKAVLPTVSQRTRTCVYDRPGTRRSDGTPTPSTTVAQPTTAGQGVDDLRAVLTAAGEAPPYLLGAGSWGGMIAMLYARTRPEEVSGLVLVDSASPFLREALTAQQWTAFLAFADGLDPVRYEVPDYSTSLDQLAAAPRLRSGLPVAVLSSDVPWQLLPTIAESETFPRWTAAQNELAAALGAEHVTETDSQHLIALQNPEAVSGAILRTLAPAARSSRTGG